MCVAGEGWGQLPARTAAQEVTNAAGSVGGSQARVFFFSGVAPPANLVTWMARQVAEVEMLLEAYQMHLDHLYNKLQVCVLLDV